MQIGYGHIVIIFDIRLRQKYLVKVVVIAGAVQETLHRVEKVKVFALVFSPTRDLCVSKHSVTNRANKVKFRETMQITAYYFYIFTCASYLQFMHHCILLFRYLLAVFDPLTYFDHVQTLAICTP